MTSPANAAPSLAVRIDNAFLSGMALSAMARSISPRARYDRRVDELR
jgi:hypothetical protein